MLAQGVSLKTGLEFGWVTNLIGLLVLAFWIPLRQKPGLGTILNVLLVGPSAQLGLDLLPQQTELWAQVLFFAAGLALLAVATGLYIGPRLGPGPRDGLMTGLHARGFGSLRLMRTGVELTVLAIGWLLGGGVGIGTVLFALSIGPLIQWFLPKVAVDRVPRNAPPYAEGD